MLLGPHFTASFYLYSISLYLYPHTVLSALLIFVYYSTYRWLGLCLGVEPWLDPLQQEDPVLLFSHGGPCKNCYGWNNTRRDRSEARSERAETKWSTLKTSLTYPWLTRFRSMQEPWWAPGRCVYRCSYNLCGSHVLWRNLKYWANHIMRSI